MITSFRWAFQVAGVSRHLLGPFTQPLGQVVTDFLPLPSTLRHLLPHPHSQVLLLPASLKGWDRIPLPGPAGTPPASRHAHLCPGSPPLLSLNHTALAFPTLLPTASTVSKFSVSETELLTFHGKLQPSSSQWRATPSF